MNEGFCESSFARAIVVRRRRSLLSSCVRCHCSSLSFVVVIVRSSVRSLSSFVVVVHSSSFVCSFVVVIVRSSVHSLLSSFVRCRRSFTVVHSSSFVVVARLFVRLFVRRFVRPFVRSSSLVHRRSLSFVRLFVVVIVAFAVRSLGSSFSPSSFVVVESCCGVATLPSLPSLAIVAIVVIVVIVGVVVTVAIHRWSLRQPERALD